MEEIRGFSLYLPLYCRRSQITRLLYTLDRKIPNCVTREKWNSWHDEGIDVKERVYFCEILVSTMTQDTSPRTEGSGDENTDLSSSRRTRRNTSRRDQRIPNLFGLTARISGFLEISLSLSLSSKAWEKTLNRTSDFDNCLRELGKTGRETTSASKRNAYFSTPDAARQR